VGEEDKITLLTLGPDHRATARKVLVPNLPTDGLHTTKTVLAGPDGRLYVAMGSTCNVCREGDPRRAAVSVYALDGSDGRVFSKGLRNAVGLAINPVTHEIWATNNGRDLWGDTRPLETLYVLQDGADYGWPRCHAGTLVDPDFGGTAGCSGVTAPVATMAAHMAPLGQAFYQGTAFPPGYRDSVYIAFHGSWNSTNLVGYKVMRVPLQDGKVAGPAEDFATGWLQDNTGSTGRPAGIVEAADGSLLVSDDKGGFVYRISAAGAR
jgi:glucose/arabinose dehydrogenase